MPTIQVSMLVYNRIRRNKRKHPGQSFDGYIREIMGIKDGEK